MKLIGLSGYARSGKDEFARVLVEEFGYERIAFADKLREVLYQLNPIVIGTEWRTAQEMADETNRAWNGPHQKRYYSNVQRVIDEHGWDGYKETPYGDEIRRLLQRLGTEAGRQTLWDSIWVDAAFANVKEDGKYVVTDMRFPNEFDAVQDRGGKTVRIERDGVGPANSHASETSLDYYTFDVKVLNDSTLKHYVDLVRYLAKEVL